MRFCLGDKKFRDNSFFQLYRPQESVKNLLVVPEHCTGKNGLTSRATGFFAMTQLRAQRRTCCGLVVVLLVRRTIGLSSFYAPEHVNYAGVKTLGTSRAPVIPNVNATVAAMRKQVPAVSEEDCRWFARDRRGDVVEATAKVRRWSKWRTSFGGLGTRRHLKRLAMSEKRKNVGYLARTRDALGRPVVVVVARRHSVSSRTFVSSQALCIDVLEDAVHMLNDDVEQFVAIVDLRRVGADQVDLPFVLWLVQTLRNFYPKRIGQVVLVEPPTLLFKAAWAVIEPNLGKHKNIVRVIDNARDLRSYFLPGSLPQDLVV